MWLRWAQKPPCTYQGAAGFASVGDRDALRVNATHVRRVLDAVAERLELRCAEDWQRVSVRLITRDSAAKQLLHAHSGVSMWQLLAVAYPERTVAAPWLFPRVPRHFWSHLAHRRMFFDWIVRTQEPAFAANPALWQQLSTPRRKELKLDSLLNAFYHGNLRLALCEIYPTLPWDTLWPNPAASVRTVLERHIAPRLPVRIESLEDWYRIKPSHLTDIAEAVSLCKGRHMGLASALRVAYPQHRWLPWRFSHAPRHIWRSRNAHRAFLDWFAASHNLAQPQDWQRIRREHLEQAGGSPHIHRALSLSI